MEAGSECRYPYSMHGDSVGFRYRVHMGSMLGVRFRYRGK